MYKLNVISKNGMQIKIYTNDSNTTAVCFRPFGRYFSLYSENALDFAVNFFLGEPSVPVNVGFATYQSSLEDTQVAAIAA